MRQAAVALFLVLFVASTNAVPNTVIDPFFLIEYDPQVVHFESVPTELGKQCTELGSIYTRAWMYSHVRIADADYYVVDGKERDMKGGNEYGSGFTVAILGSKCVVESTETFFLQRASPPYQATKLRVSEATLAAIADDLLLRYVRAFGSKAEFLKRVSPDALDGMWPFLKLEFDKLKAAP